MEKLTFEYKNIWSSLEDKENEELFNLNEDYKIFLNYSKTERDATKEIIRRAEKEGFVSLDKIIKSKQKLSPGMKVYMNNRDKGVALYIIGKDDLVKGLNIIGAHLDSPRLDIKMNPLYEESNLALFKTHYYGEIKKYQWVTIPLSLHGVVIRRDGTKVEVTIGEDEDEPVFFITDLLPHLAKDQYEKKLDEGITGEGLNIIIGSIPFNGKDIEDSIKYNVLKILNEKYGITEEDFTTAELEAVPAGKARDVGLDRGLIVAYAQDDKVCVYTCLRAILEIENPERTCVALFVDKEEIGSYGNTGMESRFFENTLIEVISLLKGNCTLLDLSRTLTNTIALSADVTSAYDPNFPDVFDRRNTAHIGRGLAIAKESANGGKNRGNDANSEYIGHVRKLFNEKNIFWQMVEIGKIDQEESGTIAYIMAHHGMDVVDCGVPVLSMHAPYEVVSKADVYMAYKGYKVFFLSNK